jgi:hypothetical protein
LDVPVEWGVAVEVEAIEEVLVEGDDDDGVLDLFSIESERLADFLVFRIEKSGA